ncbi:hypothetical protein [Phenylobacterium sp.]|jgi:hypothetical protein|uniref:hypothetical protein n=1 Tax=Phenylobacterium sp. TaxID=1871053 RepID=UPI002E30471F|nr:hypothetical protein [Phenylobacterium sp.]HEX4709742.1 hypothetical protein [Phenylobacterium sp.]
MSVKVLFAGTAMALAGGVLLGGAMRPNLGAADDGRPAGPQMFASWSGTRSTGPFDPGTTFASYGGKVPDYVLGTDWKKATAWPDERTAVSAPSREITSSEASPDEPVIVARTDYEDLPPATYDYPSLSGGHLPEPDDAATAAGD